MQRLWTARRLCNPRTPGLLCWKHAASPQRAAGPLSPRPVMAPPAALARPPGHSQPLSMFSTWDGGCSGVDCRRGTRGWAGQAAQSSLCLPTAAPADVARRRGAQPGGADDQGRVHPGRRAGPDNRARQQVQLAPVRAAGGRRQQQSAVWGRLPGPSIRAGCAACCSRCEQACRAPLNPLCRRAAAGSTPRSPAACCTARSACFCSTVKTSCCCSSGRPVRSPSPGCGPTPAAATSCTAMSPPVGVQGGCALLAG